MSPATTTERLSLRPYGPDDLATLERLFRDPDVARYLFDGQTASSEWIADEAAANAGRWSEHGYGMSLLSLGETPDEAIGFAGLRPFFDQGELQLVYGLLPAYWGVGYATEAAAEVVRACFEDHGMTEVVAVTDPPNRASIRVLERLGFRFLELLSRAGQQMVYYRLGRDRWRSALAAVESAP